MSGEPGHGLSRVKALINVTRFEAAFLPKLLPSSDSPLPFYVPKFSLFLTMALDEKLDARFDEPPCEPAGVLEDARPEDPVSEEEERRLVRKLDRRIFSYPLRASCTCSHVSHTSAVLL